MAFVEGFGIGLGMVIFLGPVFFTLLKTALNQGIAAGMLVATGIIVSDVVCLTLCSFGAIPFFENPQNQYYISLFGASILVILGVKYLFRPTINDRSGEGLNFKHYTTYFTKGFLVNFVNPFVFLVWISLIGFGQSRYGTGINLWIFLSAIMLGIFLTDSLKVLLAHRIKDFLNQKLLLAVHRVIGVVLLVFGVRLLWFALA